MVLVEIAVLSIQLSKDYAIHTRKMGISSAPIIPPDPLLSFSALSFRAWIRRLRALISSRLGDERGSSSGSYMIGGSGSFWGFFGVLAGNVEVGVGSGVISRRDLLGRGRGGDGGFALGFGRGGGDAALAFAVGRGFEAAAGAREGARDGASRSSSSSEVSSFATGAVALPCPCDCNAVLPLCSDLSYPAAALVCDMTPCRPVRLAKAFFGLVVMNRCRCVPSHGCSWPSFSSRSLSSLVVTGRLGPLMLSNPAFVLASCASASFFFFVSARMAVMLSTGLEIFETVALFRFFASFLRRTYSA